MDKAQNKRLFGMLGFAMRAGRVTIGVELVLSLIAKRKAFLVCYACDASDATKKKISTKCDFYRARAIELPIPSTELGRLLGKTYAPAAVAITDTAFADEIYRAVIQE